MVPSIGASLASDTRGISPRQPFGAHCMLSPLAAKRPRSRTNGNECRRQAVFYLMLHLVTGENPMTKLPLMIVAAVVLAAPFPASAEDVPDALSVEWQGKKPCEKLHEDDQIRVLRCTFPPGTKHVRHQHPANFIYTLSGGKIVVENANGVQPQQELATDFSTLSPPVPWHEGTNTGDTTLRFLIIEMKYKK